MNKVSVWALALLAVTTQAQADGVLYGQIKGGIGHNSNKDGGSISKIEDYRSKIGFKGAESLGDSTELVWQVENAISIAGNQAGNGNQWNTFDTFVGLKNTDWGSVKLGYVSDGMLGVPNQKMQVDPWESNTDINDPKGMKMFTRAEKRLAGVRYDMPKMAGVDFNITHQLADASGTGDFDGATVFNQATVVAAGYQHQAWYLKAAAGLYKHQSRDQAKVEDAKLYRVLAGYDDKKTMVGAGFQYMDGFQGLWSRKAATANQGLRPTATTKEALLTASHKWGRYTPRIAYAHGWDERRGHMGRVANTSYDQVIVGGDYALSKTTTALLTAAWLQRPVAYSVASNGDVAGLKNTVYGVGLGLKTVF